MAASPTCSSRFSEAPSRCPDDLTDEIKEMIWFKRRGNCFYELKVYGDFLEVFLPMFNFLDFTSFAFFTFILEVPGSTQTEEKQKVEIQAKLLSSIVKVYVSVR